METHTFYQAHPIGHDHSLVAVYFFFLLLSVIDMSIPLIFLLLDLFVRQCPSLTEKNEGSHLRIPGVIKALSNTVQQHVNKFHLNFDC